MKYAQFNPQDSSSITPIIGWYHVYDEASDPSGDIFQMLPAAAELVEVPDAIWNDPARCGSYSVDKSSTPKIVPTPAPSAAQQLATAKSAQIVLMYADYANAIAQPVAYTTKAGVAQTFQSDPVSISNVANMLNAYSGTQVTPTGFYWVAADNTKVPFTYADLQGLAAAMGNQGWTAFQNLQTRKASINAATTIADVQAVAW